MLHRCEGILSLRDYKQGWLAESHLPDPVCNRVPERFQGLVSIERVLLRVIEVLQRLLVAPCVCLKVSYTAMLFTDCMCASSPVSAACMHMPFAWVQRTFITSP